MGTDAGAKCDDLGDALKAKMRAYIAYRDKNQESLSSLVSAQTTCQDRGATVSAKLAGMAAAKSCEAQADAGGLNEEMTEIGAKCESHFQTILELQKELHAQFDIVNADLTQATDYMSESKFLLKHCAKELEAAKQMVANFLVLEENIEAVQARSFDSEVSYGKFKETAQNLKTLTKAGGQNCAEMASAVSATLGATKTAGMASAGKSARDDSTVTGKLRNEALPGTLEASPKRFGNPEPGIAPEIRHVATTARSVAGSIQEAPDGKPVGTSRAPASEKLGTVVPSGHSTTKEPSPSMGSILFREAINRNGTELELSLPKNEGRVVNQGLPAREPVAGAGSSAESDRRSLGSELIPEQLNLGGLSTSAPVGTEQSLFEVIHHYYRGSALFRSAR